MQLFIKALILAVVMYFQALSAETFSISVCETPLKFVLSTFKETAYEDYPHYWVKFSKRKPLSFEPEFADNDDRNDIIDNKMKSKVNGCADYEEETKCKEVYSTSDFNDDAARYRAMEGVFDEATKGCFYSIKESLLRFDVSDSKCITSAALKRAKLDFPTNFDTEFKIEVCKISLKISQNDKNIPDNLWHVWVQAKEDDKITFVRSFEARENQFTKIDIIFNEDVQSKVEKSYNVNGEHECAELGRTSDKEMFKKWLTPIEKVYANAAYTGYNLYSNNCSMVAKKAVKAAGMEFPYTGINAMNYTKDLVSSINNTILDPNTKNITVSVLYGAATGLNICDQNSSNIVDALCGVAAGLNMLSKRS